MACLFGHKWNRCKCTKCGTVNNKNHNFTQESVCVDICTICGKSSFHHSIVENKCTVCGKEYVLMPEVTEKNAHNIQGFVAAITLLASDDDEEKAKKHKRCLEEMASNPKYVPLDIVQGNHFFQEWLGLK